MYEGQYLLGTSIARPLIAKRQIEIAEKVGADAVSHGSTGKGNDQVRYELAYYALKPDIKIIAPWREWEFAAREKLIEFAEQHQIPIAKDKRGEAPFSVDANLLHTSSEGKVLEDPAQVVPDYVYSRTIDPEKAPDKPTVITVDFERGDAIAIDGKKLSPAALLAKLNDSATPTASAGSTWSRTALSASSRAACTKRPAAPSCCRRIAASSRSRSIAAPRISRTS